MYTKTMKAVSFAESPVYDIAMGKAHTFDVISKDKGFFINSQFLMEEYCRSLLIKINELSFVQLKHFLHYQTQALSKPLLWLNSLDELVSLNIELFDDKLAHLKAGRILVLSQLLAQALENNTYNLPQKFDFTQVRKKLGAMPGSKEQLDYLYELKADYLQNKPLHLHPSDIPLDEKINIEIEKIELIKANVETSQVPNQKKAVKNNVPYIDNETFIIMMKVSKRTARRWREGGIIPFTQIGGKVYYKLLDVEAILNKNYIGAIKPFPL